MSNYNENAIEVLEGIEAIRLRPGMYIGGRGSSGLHHLVWEIVNNSLDEHMNGFGDEVIITLHADDAITVQDFGRGIPTGIHPKTGISTLETILTLPHAGGKFGGGGYKVSGGLHGVGATCTNAYSIELIATVNRAAEDKTAAHSLTQWYSRGKKVKEKRGAYKGRPGTSVYFKPDTKELDPEEGIFEVASFNADTIRHRLRQYAFLCPTIQLKFINEKEQTEELIHFPNGLLDYIKFEQKINLPLHEPWVIREEKDDVSADILLQWTDSFSTSIISFANLIATKEGGTHETGVKSAITRTMNEVATAKGWLKENLTGDEWLEGLTAIISIKLPEPEFEGQTKNKLSNSNVRSILSQMVSDTLNRIFADPKQLQAVKAIAEKALLARQAREASKKAQQLIRDQEKKKKDKYEHLVSGKFAPCTTKDPSKREFFIVEGESAGGSAKQARDRITQAIQMLKGKVLNVENNRIDRVLDNEEIRSIIINLGCGIGDECDPGKLQYDKVVIMTDADEDGSHIRILLLTFFFRYMLQIVRAGCVYIAQPPLYKVYKDKKVQYAWTVKERDAGLKKLGKGSLSQRFKGLGEMNPDQLWDTTMNPDSRRLYKVTVDDVLELDQMFASLMGEKAETRRDFLVENARHLKDVTV